MHMRSSGKLKSSSCNLQSSTSLSSQSSGELQPVIGLYSNITSKNHYKNVFPKQLIALMVQVLGDICKKDPNALITIATAPAMGEERLFFPRFRIRVKKVVDGKEIVKDKVIKSNEKLTALFAKQRAAEDNTLTELLHAIHSEYSALDTTKITLANTLAIKQLISDIFAPIEESPEWKTFWAKMAAQLESTEMKLDIKRLIANSVAFYFFSQLAERDVDLAKKTAKLTIVINSREDAEKSFLQQKEKILTPFHRQFKSTTSELGRYIEQGNSESALHLLGTWGYDLNKFFCNDINVQYVSSPVHALGAEGYIEFNKALGSSLDELASIKIENPAKHTIIAKYTLIILELIRVRYSDSIEYLRAYEKAEDLHISCKELLRKTFELLQAVDPDQAAKRNKTCKEMHHRFCVYVSAARNGKDKEKEHKKDQSSAGLFSFLKSDKSKADKNTKKLGM